MQREYPEAPIAAVGAVIVSDAGEILLIERGQEPHKGTWSLPGGVVELGEPLDLALRREVLEETGLVVSPLKVVEVVDRILRDDHGQVRYHYIVVDYVCVVTGGALSCASDAANACWFAPVELAWRQPPLDATLLAVIQKALFYHG